MKEFWEQSFVDKQEMWGSSPVDSALKCAVRFKQYGLKRVLIPGMGYGRNAKPFIDQGLELSGIEISETAIQLARRHLGNTIPIQHGSVTDMPFDTQTYDGIYCYALLHLLSQPERSAFIAACYQQLKPGGYMVFVSLSKRDMRYGKGETVQPDTFQTAHGISLFFYDKRSVAEAFGQFGLVGVEELSEPSKPQPGQVVQQFVEITCQKTETHSNTPKPF